MGNIYVTCARCNKGMTIAEYNCVFCSDIDNQFVCADCYKKEQPKELMKRITDLEAKLAESEKTEDGAFWFEKWQHKKRDYDSVYKAYIENCKEIDQLKQQLEEKEKEIVKHKAETVTFTPKLVNNAELVIKIIQSDADGIDYLKQLQNQIAIAELKKAKESLLDLWFEDFGVCRYEIEETIDQQIKSLKGEADGSSN